MLPELTWLKVEDRSVGQTVTKGAFSCFLFFIIKERGSTLSKMEI